MKALTIRESNNDDTRIKIEEDEFVINDGDRFDLKE